MDNKPNNQKELAIIGAGIAGVSAAIYAQRCGLDFLIFEAGAVGGQLLFMENIDNYAGLKLGSKGSDLAKSLEQALADLAVPLVNEEIVKIELDKDYLNLYTVNSVYSAKSAIVATGASFKKLGLEREGEFLGKGLSYCAVCDGFFFKGKEVAVVGGGNTALEEALYLAELAKQVTVIHRRDSLRGLNYLQKQLSQKNNIRVLLNSVVRQLNGQDSLREIVVENTKDQQRQTLGLNGLFIAIGVKPNTAVFNPLISQDEAGFIITDHQMRSSLPLIWAAGDCRQRPLRQLITAAGEGAVAALSAYKHLRGHYVSA